MGRPRTQRPADGQDQAQATPTARAAANAALFGPLVQMEPLHVDLETLTRLTPLSESTIELEEREGRFPKRRKLSGRRTGWLYAEVKAWAAGCPVSDLPPPPNTARKKGEEKADATP